MNAVMNMKRRLDDQTLHRIIRFWPLIVCIVGGIATVAVMQNRVESHETRLTSVEAEVKDLQKIKANTDLLVDVLIRRRERSRND